MILYGKNSVLERLKANPKTIKKIFLQDNFSSPTVENLIKEKKIPSERSSPGKLSRIKPGKDLRGIAALVEDFAYTPYADLLNRGLDEQSTPVFLDRINDPQNLGGIIRVLACFGNFGIVVPQHGSCEVTEAVLHVASGGENYLPVAKVGNLSNAIIAAKKRGYWIAGAVLGENAEDLGSVKFPFPLGIVLGSEGKGIRHGIDIRLDIRARIPMDGARLSFNVNSAAAIFCYEISKQRKDVKVARP